MSANFIPSEEDMKKIQPFKFWSITNFPFIADDFDQMTYYEILCKLVDYLNKVIDNNNAIINNENGLYNAFIQLQNYVNNYFTDLNVQAQIDHKLDEMVESGYFDNYLNNYLSLTKIYDTTVQMLADGENLVDGEKVRTLGYYSVNDGGGADFIITDTVNSNAYQFEVDTDLYAELIVVNDTINIKQLGAKGTGTDDDTQIFLNAINFINDSTCQILFIPNGQYLINASLRISNISIIGESKENTILIANSYETEGFFKNKNYLNYGQFDTFTLENFTIYKKAQNTNGEIGKRCFQLSCCNNCILRNIYAYSDINTGFGGIDMYSNNKNMLIENVTIEATNVTNNKLSGGISIREYGTNYISENIIIRDCKVEKNGHDELLWISSWRGYIRNVLFDNLTLIDNDETANQVSSCYIAGDLVDSVKNIKIVNSYFKRSALRYAFFKIGESNINNTTSDILLDNCTFECDQPQTNSTSILRSGKSLFGNGLTISNCLFKNNQTDTSVKLGQFISGNEEGICNSINNSYIGMSTWSIINITSSKNDFIDSNSDYPFRNCKIIDNPTIAKSHTYFLTIDHSSYDKFYLKNISGASFTRFISASSPATNSNLYIINCDINLSDDNICNAYGVDENNILTLNFMSSNFNGTKKLTNSSYVAVNNVNTTYNYNTYGIIPTHQKSRNAFVVGTTFISSNATKSVIRKVSAGDSTSNWEEV